MNVAELRIPKDLRLELTYLDVFSVPSGQPRLQRAGRNGCPTGRLDAILYRGEYTTSYRFVNEFILVAESMSCGDRRGGRERYGCSGKEDKEASTQRKGAKKDNAETQRTRRSAEARKTI